MQYLKECARVSKFNLKNLLTQFNSEKKTVYKKDNSACNGCSFNVLFLDDKQSFVREEYCNNYCSKNKAVEYSYTAMEKETSLGIFEVLSDLKTALQLTKTAIKQYLVYHFIPSNSSYVKKGISYKHIAELCNISVPTARKNHKNLVSAGLVYSTTSMHNKKLMDIVIDSEYKYHAKKKTSIEDLNEEELEDAVKDSLKEDELVDDKTQGYVTISLDLLNHLLGLNNVNELKVELRKILWLDAATSKIGDSVLFNKENLVIDLPNYAKTPKNRAKLIHSANSLFSVNDLGIEKDGYEPSDVLNNRIVNEARELVKNIFEITNTPVNKEHSELLTKWNNITDDAKPFNNNIFRKAVLLKEWVINDIALLIRQYNTDIVLKHLNIYIDKYTYTDNDMNIKTTIRNTGAFLRSQITRELAVYSNM